MKLKCDDQACTVHDHAFSSRTRRDEKGYKLYY